MTDDRKETQILAAAREEFLQRGYAGTSMDGVARRAHASKTTLYTRFPSKDALFAATIADECQAGGVDFAASDLDTLSVDEALRLIGSRVAALVSSPAAVRMEQVVNGEAARFPEVAETFLREGPDRVRAAVAAYLSRAAGRGLITIDDADFAAGQFLAGLHDPLHCQLMTGRCPSPTVDEQKVFVDKVVGLFIHGLRPS